MLLTTKIALRSNGPSWPVDLGMFWQTMNDNVDYRRSWEKLGISKTMFQWVAVDDSSFITGSSLPMHLKQLNLTDVATYPWADEIVIGLPGMNDTAQSRTAVNVEKLITQAEQFAAFTYPDEATGKGFYFPVEIDPGWTDIDTALTTSRWNRLRAFAGTLYVSVYYGNDTYLSNLGLNAQTAAAWVATHIPGDVVVLFQDGVGAHDVPINTAITRYRALQDALGTARVELIAEAFRYNPDHNDVPGQYYKSATAAQLRQQMFAYRNFKTWLFDGPEYLTTQLIQEVLNEVPVLPPSSLAAGKYGNNDLLLSWTRTSQGGASVSGYEVYIYESGGNTIIRTIQVTGTTTSVTYPAAQAYADAGNQVMTFVVFRVSEKSTTGFVSDKSNMFAATATDLVDPPGTYGVLMTGGQSNMDQHFGSLSYNGTSQSYVKIIDNATTALGLSSGAITMVNGATGGSAADIVTAPSWGTSLYWYDSTLNQDGPMLTAWIAKYNALKAQYPSANIMGVIWAQGEADVSAYEETPSRGTLVSFKAALQYIFARMRAVVGNANLPIWIQPLSISYWNYGTEGLDIIGSTYEKFRDVQVEIAIEQANTRVGAWPNYGEYSAFVQETDPNTGQSIGGRIHYMPFKYHKLAQDMGLAIGGNIDRTGSPPPWLGLRAPTNIEARLNANNDVVVTWDARAPITQWRLISIKMDGSGFWVNTLLATNTYTIPAATHLSNTGFVTGYVGIYVAEHDGSVVGNAGKFVDNPLPYAGGGGGSGLSAPTGLTATQSGNDWIYSWDADAAVDFEIVNQDASANGTVISTNIISTNTITFTAAQQQTYYGYLAGYTLYKVRKVNRTTLETGSFTGLPWLV